jgi:hypothetical protein
VQAALTEPLQHVSIGQKQVGSKLQLSETATPLGIPRCRWHSIQHPPELSGCGRRVARPATQWALDENHRVGQRGQNLCNLATVPGGSAVR